MEKERDKLLEGATRGAIVTICCRNFSHTTATPVGGSGKTLRGKLYDHFPCPTSAEEEDSGGDFIPCNTFIKGEDGLVYQVHDKVMDLSDPEYTRGPYCGQEVEFYTTKKPKGKKLWAMRIKFL